MDDLSIDVIVPTDGRPYRQPDLEEFAAAVRAGALALDAALDALARWQAFLDRGLHATRCSAAGWTDFPPAAIAPLRDLRTPIGGES